MDRTAELTRLALRTSYEFSHPFIVLFFKQRDFELRLLHLHS